MAGTKRKFGWGTAWAAVFGLGALAFWVVSIGAGWRAWLLLDDLEPDRGIVAHAQAFGTDASVWWVPATVLTLTTVLIVIAVAAKRPLGPGKEEQSAGADDELPEPTAEETPESASSTS